ncbi:MAG: hypothetical protein DPW18_12855 [Chloroflexi bacterium]|nr:hypothetical protein [Chloroflexota bacterium]MDL1943862.1 hypothetical protein [Chloroflexi bacterium CFX2]
MDESLVWQVRHFVYSHFAEAAHPPSVDEIVAHLGISTDQASELYKELHNRHALFLDVEKAAIRMAWPFSGIPTDFKVHAGGKTYFANCAWDMLGIPAALHADAVIEAVCTESNELVRLEIKNGNIAPAAVPGGGGAASSSLLVHFPLPFSHWYDDLVFT